MSGRFPFAEDLLVAPGRAAALRPGQTLGGNGRLVGRAGQAGSERTIIGVQRIVRLPHLVICREGSGLRTQAHHASRRGQQQEGHDGECGDLHPKTPGAGEPPRDAVGAGGLLHPPRGRRDVPEREDEDGDGAPAVRNAPPMPCADVQHGLPRHDHAGHEADDQRDRGRIPEDTEIADRMAPIGTPVAQQVPADGQQRGDADGRVQQHGPLRDGTEGQQPDRDAAQDQEPEGPSRSKGERRLPPLTFG